MHDPMVVAFEIRRPWPSRNGPTRRYWPSLVTVWHVEPGGADSGEVCKHYRRDQQPDGVWETTLLNAWRWHVHHWRIQVRPLQTLRRWALTRCAWCGGRQGKHDPVNVSHSWDGPRGRWWQGEPGVYHHDCSSIAGAHAECLCTDPVLVNNGWGRCARCDKPRGFKVSAFVLEQRRMLASVPAGERDPDTTARVEARWKAEPVADKEADDA